MKAASAAILALVLAGAAPANAVQENAPAPAAAVAVEGPVTDAAGILTSAQEERLTAKLKALQQTTGHQLAVVTVESLDGEDASAFTKDLANGWGVGDGAVLLVAPHERKARIAVGLGLDKELPEALCQQIMEEQMVPHFKAGDLPGGIEAGVDALIARLK